MAIVGVRIIYICVSALMTMPIFLNLYNQKTTSVEGVDVSLSENSQTRKILETSYEEIDSNETVTVKTDIMNGPPDITKGIVTKILYKKGFSQPGLDICPNKGNNRKLLMIITSSPDHEEARNVIRNYWGKYALSKNVSVGFLLGFTPNKTIEKAVKNEQKLHKDIIVGNSLDSYDNLTLKTISALEWVDTYCPKVQFVLKTDDDVFINVERLLSFLLSVDPHTDAIYGRLAKNWKPIRNATSKYYTSFKQYEPVVFPTFTTGPAYVIPARISHKLFEAALSKIYFKLEDVFTTGLVAQSLGIKRQLVPGILNKRINFTPCNVKKHISFHPLKKDEPSQIWKMLHENVKCRT